MIKRKFFLGKLLIVLCMGIAPNCFAQVAATDTISPVQQALKTALGKAKDIPSHTQELYKDFAYKPIWLHEGRWSLRAEQAIKTLQNSGAEGLDLRDYSPALEQVRTANRQDQNALIQAEISLTNAILKYIQHLSGGRLRPRSIDRGLAIKPEVADPSYVFLKGFSRDRTCQWLTKLTLDMPGYQKLKKLLQELDQIESSGEMPKLSSGKALKKGDKGLRVEQLRIILTLRGILVDAIAATLFDEPLESAVKTFQVRHHLKVDGAVGEQTRRFLNMDLKKMREHVVISMERCRWLPKEMGDRHILVNIAGFYLKAVDNGKVAFTMPVIVGRNYRETPVFSTSVTGVRFNPTWNVPRSIAVKDKLPKIKKDPSYLSRKGYRLYDSSGSRIDSGQINWSQVNTRTFHYRIKQPPGAGNALGKLRFLMSNPHNVYLHGTPQHKLFEKNVRTFSSGCIRLKEPAKVAYFVFDNPAKWSSEVITNEMKGSKTRNVNVKTPVPVHITYFTVWVDEENEPHFVADPYGQDAQIWKALEARFASNAVVAERG
ncbi:MAG: L,D-transpeptidase family protein [bacterium]|nr:L,D-transpeptidase family protein [bacterium]